jgi:hypothetical protein
MDEKAKRNGKAQTKNIQEKLWQTETLMLKHKSKTFCHMLLWKFHDFKY